MKILIPGEMVPLVKTTIFPSAIWFMSGRVYNRKNSTSNVWQFFKDLQVFQICGNPAITMFDDFYSKGRWGIEAGEWYVLKGHMPGQSYSVVPATQPHTQVVPAGKLFKANKAMTTGQVCTILYKYYVHPCW